MKNFPKVLIALVVVLAIGFLLLLSQVNTERNKQAIQAAVRDATGYDLIIGGDLSLSLFPTLGLSLNDIRARNPAFPQELASASRAVLQIDLLSILGGEFRVEEITAENFHANYFVQADGRSIWTINEEDEVQPTAGDAANDYPLQGLSIERLRIANASIDIQDQSQGLRYRIDNLNLDSTDTNLAGRPFSVDLQFDYENNGMSAPIPMSLYADIRSDLAAGSANLDNVRLSVTPMLLQGSVALAGLNESPTLQANFSAAPFDVLGLMESLALREPNPQLDLALDAGRQLSLQLEIEGNSQQLSVPRFELNFAGTTINATADVRFATGLAPTSVSYSVIAGDIDLTPLFPDTEEADENAAVEAEPEPAQNQVAQYQPETEIPAELLRSISLLGSVAIDSVTANNIRLDNINLYTNVEDGVLDIELTPVELFEGNVQGTLRIDARSTTPELQVGSAIQDLNLAELAPSVSRLSTVSGFLQAESNYTARGLTASALMDSVSGNTAFRVTENSVDIGVIKQVFTAIAALSPTGEAIQQWPDVIRFNSMSGYWLVNDGLDTDQELKLRMDNFDVSGGGGLDMEAGTFDYDLLFTVLGEPFTQTIPINNLYHDVPWPVDCSAAFDDPVNRYCRPDFTRVREIFGQIGTNAVRNRLQEVITDQAPTELQDSARGLLRSIFN
ncbi:MAG: AsmA family protein [Proteobacteria bacterium]|nr:AsmA family protein [Pseudomonadota bacterium]MDA0926489.1 AsmA family protein [Pseudomonadota bacterium]